MSNKKMTMGLIVGNRGFFPGHLATEGREEMTRALAQAGMDCVVLGQTKASTAPWKRTKKPSFVPSFSRTTAIALTA